MNQTYQVVLEEIKEAAEQSIASQEGIRTIKLLDVTDALAKKIPEGKKEIMNFKKRLLGSSKDYGIDADDLERQLDFDFHRMALLQLKDAKPLTKEQQEEVINFKTRLLESSKAHGIDMDDLRMRLDFDFYRMALSQLNNTKVLTKEKQEEKDDVILDVKNSIVITIANQMRLSNGRKRNFYPFTEFEIYEFEDVPSYLDWKYSELSRVELIRLMYKGITYENDEGLFLKEDGRVILAWN